MILSPARRPLRPALFPAALAALAALAAALAFAQEPPLAELSTFPKAKLEIRSGKETQKFDIWVADTPARQEQGLMFVRDLPADQGMLFTESAPRVVSMWMKNTYIELDMVFIRADGRIASIAAHTVPHSLKAISAGEPVKAVLEIRGGEAERRGLKAGDVVVLPATGMRTIQPVQAPVH